MKSIFTLFFLFLTSLTTYSQLVINELDSDSDSVDNLEFVEIKSNTPNFNLNGYILVFFNASTSGGNSSYLTFDLSGYTTDVNGLLLIGSSQVSPVPQYIISPNLIQNGADGVAIYQDSPSAFPEGTLATQTNLIDALVYGTSDADATSLMALLGETVQIDEDENNNKDFESIQLNNDGVTYTVTTPTPRQLNDGSGIVLNGLTISTTATQYDEGNNFDITFTTENAVSQDETFSFSLNNAGFDNSDFTGSTTLTILSGNNSVTTNIQLIDDTSDEGDEVAVIQLTNLPSDFIALNDQIELRIVDNDFVVSPWGTPINPTFGTVANTKPAGYYTPIDGLSGTNLTDALQGIIAEEGVVRAQTYADVIDILKKADQNPANSNEVWLVYLEISRPKLDFQTTSNNFGTWNREHTYPRSRGGFASIEDDDIADGKNIFWNTNADSLRHGNSDAHALRAVDGPENSSRNNQHYGEYTGPQNTQGSFKGDVARSVLYMAIRYNNLAIVNGFPENGPGELGDLATLLTWHRNDPPDDFEMNRNNVVYEWQKNRNPFIDYPDLVEYIWGNQVGNTWNNPLNVDSLSENEISVYPNPSSGSIFVNGINGNFTLSVYNVTGQKLNTFEATHAEEIQLNLSTGVYLLQVDKDHHKFTKKLIVK
ncbi:endonuclease [Mesonia sp. K4-1]|uniref:endonuclease n=1 Tax=Mesonia sp. K4-1 TaxID=2602760 RepID=UPI0011CCBF7F|nr:endonuclease [Mesonia sp. K4-1]TXK76867.1 T9SS type A sorting domain-containing protein [Mesonia sp. K4-1]